MWRLVKPVVVWCVLVLFVGSMWTENWWWGHAPHPRDHGLFWWELQGDGELALLAMADELFWSSALLVTLLMILWTRVQRWMFSHHPVEPSGPAS